MLLTAIAIAAGVAAVVAVVVVAGMRARTADLHYRLLLENLPQTAVVLFDHDLRFQLIAGGALQSSEVDPGEVQGKLLSEVVPGEQGDVLARHYRAALRGESRSIEYSSERDGRDYWLHVVPVYEGEKLTGGMAVSQDISEHKAAERARELAEGRRRLTIDAMNEAYVAIDHNGVVIDWNPRAEQLFGFEPGEAIGRRAIDLILPADDHEPFSRLIDRYLDPAKDPSRSTSGPSVPQSTATGTASRWSSPRRPTTTRTRSFSTLSCTTSAAANAPRRRRFGTRPRLRRSPLRPASSLAALTPSRRGRRSAARR